MSLNNIEDILKNDTSTLAALDKKELVEALVKLIKHTKTVQDQTKAETSIKESESSSDFPTPVADDSPPDGEFETSRNVYAGIDACTKLQRDPNFHKSFSDHDAFVAEITKKLAPNEPLEDVKPYENDADIPIAAARQFGVAKSIVRVVVLVNPSPLKKWGTGFVISLGAEKRRFVITNSHHYDAGASGYVHYDYDTHSSRGVKRGIIGEVWRSPQTENISQPYPDAKHLDFVVIEIERDADGRDEIEYPPLAFEESQRVKYLTKRSVVLIGHPHGGPKKASFGKVVSTETSDDVVYFEHEIPTCAGSSGSPLFFLPCGHVSDGTQVLALHYRNLTAVSFESILALVRTQTVRKKKNPNEFPFPLLKVAGSQELFYEFLPDA